MSFRFVKVRDRPKSHVYSCNPQRIKVNHEPFFDFETAEMAGVAGVYRATIPADYTKSEFALQYYFELQHSPKQASMYPGLGPDLTNRPYFVVEQA